MIDQKEKIFLEPSPFFFGPLRPLPRFLNAATREILPAESVLTLQDTVAHHVHYLEKGGCTQSARDSSGIDTVSRILGSGILIGAVPILTKTPHYSNTTAISECSLWTLSANRFNDLLQSDIVFGNWIAVRCGFEMNCLAEQDAITRQPTARSKVEHFLVWMMQRMFPGSSAITPPLTQSQSAKLLGLTTEHYSDVFKRMEVEGILKRQQGVIEITRPDLLPFVEPRSRRD